MCDRSRVKRWQALVALAIGLAVAGLPTAAVPMGSGGRVGAAARDAGPAAALVVEAVLRVTASAPRDRGLSATS